MPNWKLFRESITAARSDAPIGDAALLKLAAFNAPTSDIAEQLKDLQGYNPDIDIQELRRLPEGTFGRAYAEFMVENGVEPFEFTERALDLVGHDPFAIRYTSTHDMFHVLSGFDTGLAGEAGVFAFTTGQETSPGGAAPMWFQRFLYPLASPLQTWRIWRNSRVGRKMGEQSSLLLSQRLEEHFHLPLAEVRRKFGIPDPEQAGVVASSKSWIADSLYGWFSKGAAVETRADERDGRSDELREAA